MQKPANVNEKVARQKNEWFRDMLTQCWQNFRFYYVVCDSWFSSTENMNFLKGKIGVNFVMVLKSNRKVALSLKDKQVKEYVSIKSLQPGQQTK